MPARTGVTAAKTASSSLQGMQAGSSTRSVALVLLSVAVGLLGGDLTSAVAASRSGIEPGQVLVTDQEAGAVLAIGDEGGSTVVLGDLGSARGVVVLSDGAILVADSDAGAIVGTGGRFGDERVEVARGLEAPEGLAVAGGGRLYVTSFSEGTLSQVDISSGQVAGLAAGLEGPAAVLPLREPRSPNHVVVAEWFSGRVADLRRDGERVSTLVRGLERPAGLATDGDGTLYVSDRAAGEIVAVDAEGQRQVIAEVDAPTGISLDPAEPGPGQDYDLVVASGEGVLRVDVASGDTTVVDDLASGAAVVVAPDEFVVAAATATTVGEGGSDGAAGGDQVASGVDGRDLDPVMVALVAIAVFLFGVALVSGIQVWRARGDDEEAGGDRYAGLPRKERRRARRTDKAVQAAERKTAKEVDKAEKRAAKLAPDPEPVVAAAATASAPGRKERREAQRQAKAQAKAAEVNAKRQATLDAHHARQEAARGKADEKQAKAQAKADAKAEAQQDKQAKADGRAASKAATTASPHPEVDASTSSRPSGAAAPPWPGDATVPPGLGTDRSATAHSDAAGEVPGSRAPLFAAPTAAPLTAGPFLESLFTEDVATTEGAHDASDLSAEPAPALEPEPEPPVEAEPVPAPSGAAASPAPFAPAVAPVPAATPPRVPAVARRSSLEPAAAPDDAPPVDLSAEVAREVPPPKGVRGRRRAKRRFQAAEHRHRQLRAITSILSVPPPALPPAPVHRAIGVASAASVATPDAAPGLASAPAAIGAGSAGGPDTAPGESPQAPEAGAPFDPGEPPAVPWPGDGDSGDPGAAWPNQPAR